MCRVGVVWCGVVWEASLAGLEAKSSYKGHQRGSERYEGQVVVVAVRLINRLSRYTWYVRRQRRTRYVLRYVLSLQPEGQEGQRLSGKNARSPASPDVTYVY